MEKKKSRPPQLAPGKKRYYLTLNQEKMELFQQQLRQMGAPKGTESILIDDFVRGMVDIIGPVILRIKEEGREPSFGDFMVMCGNALNEFKDDQLKL